MTDDIFATLLTPQTLQQLFPKERANQFFDALLGDASEGAYDIELAYRGVSAGQLILDLRLLQRPGHCLACNLTQGLPQVFSRHPVIDIKGLVQDIEKLAGGAVRCSEWSLGRTEQPDRATHLIPLRISYQAA